MCGGKTRHAKTIRVMLDRKAFKPCTLFDCFIYLHDPTKARSHSKQAAGTDRNRSCLSVPTSRGKEGEATATADYEIVAAVKEAVEE